MNEQLTSTWPILDEAHRALRTVVAGVRDGDWERPTPCSQWNVTQVLQHAAGDQLGFAATITGSGWPAYDPFAPDGHLHGADPADFAAVTMRAAAAAWATIPQDATDAPTPLPQGRMAGWLGAGACALDAAVHAWDIAVATGQPSPLTPELARDLLVVARELVEPLRQWGAYAAVVSGADGDDDVDELLRYLGRDPEWYA
ncbi:TIGR03086 family metal-binding protein [Dactylosporangium sp. NPDC005572]|uniref:TIGR03086 family metal-binding protein n=1 Tax=Dactylosporangium sp. NPDC005572 TaxID=3156889 RepID=UPI0033B8839E